jgi:hypothetical protein
MAGDTYYEGKAKEEAGAAIAIALVEELHKSGVLTAEQVRNIYRAAGQKTAGLTNAWSVDRFLGDLAKNVREDG